MTSAFRIAANASRVGFEDFKVSYTWSTWAFGWVTRMIAQVLFFAAMGLLVGGPDFVLYAFVGNVCAIAALQPLGSGPDTAWERSLGTLPLLVAAPHSMLPVFAGRSGFSIAQGLGESTLVFMILAPLLGWTGSWWWLPLGLITLCLGSYGFGLFLASISIRRPRSGNILFNLSFYTLIAICGVNVPTDVFPDAVERIASVLPMYHGILGTRSLLTDGAAVYAFAELGRELLVGAGWFVLAMIGFRLFSEGGRRDGSIDLVE